MPTKSTHKKSKTVASKYLSAKPKNVKTRDVNSLSQAEPVNNNMSVEPVNNNVSAEAANHNVNAQAAKVHRKVCILKLSITLN